MFDIQMQLLNILIWAVFMLIVSYTWIKQPFFLTEQGRVSIYTLKGHLN